MPVDPVDRAPQPKAPAVLALVARDRVSRWVFTVLGVALTVAYMLLLTVDKTKHLAWSNWTHLTGVLVFFSLALGMGLAAVLTLQVFAAREARVDRRGGLASGVGLVASLAPSVCCTPLLPTVLATAGVSALGVGTIAPPVQHFFAAYKMAFLAGSLVLLLAIGWWSTRRIARYSTPTQATRATACGTA